MTQGWSDPREPQDQDGGYYQSRPVIDPCPCGYSKRDCAELKDKRVANGWCKSPAWEPSP